MNKSTDSNLPLYPDHLADLRKSGLSTESIKAMGVYSLPREKIGELLGWTPQGVESALVFPYPGTDGFPRLKIFPPQQDEDGHTIKYLQPKGSGVRLYVLPQVRGVLNDPTLPLYMTEGEKKAALLAQVGKMAVGLGGIWNWRNKENPQPIAELDEIVWKGRLVYLVPDSDAKHNDQVLLAVYALGRVLEQRGATVLVVKIPDLGGLEKTGVDDYLSSKNSKTFQRLCEKAIPLTHSVFRAFRLRERKQAMTKTESLPEELKGRHVHPALHFEATWASVGVIRLIEAGPAWFLITSQQQVHAFSEASGGLLFPSPVYSALMGRWPEEELQTFLNGSQGGSFAKMAALIIDQLRSLVELKHSAEYAVITAWAIGTYFFPLFAAFPRLNLIGEKGSGKSKLQALLAEVCFNGLFRVNPTPAVLFRLAAALRPTLCLDEVEGLSTEDRREILAIINSGYKRGAAVDRVEGDERRIVSYPVYTPVSLSGIRELNAVTEDRAIVLVMEKGQNPSRLNAIVDPANPIWGTIRSLGYQLALTRFSDVSATYERLQMPHWLMGRERELWTPLLVMAQMIDAEGNLGITSDLLALAQTHIEERSNFSAEAEALVGVLEGMLVGKTEIELRPGDLCGALETALNCKHISPQMVGGILRRLGFLRKDRGRLGRSVGSIYKVTSEKLEQVKARYSPLCIATLQQPDDCNSSTP